MASSGPHLAGMITKNCSDHFKQNQRDANLGIAEQGQDSDEVAGDTDQHEENAGDDGELKEGVRVFG